MSIINLKPDKVRTRYGAPTLDQCHSNKMETFQRERESLPAKEKKLATYKQILSEIENKDPKLVTDDDIKSKSKCKTLIEELVNEITKIKSGSDEMEYFSGVAETLAKYYADTYGSMNVIDMINDMPNDYDLFDNNFCNSRHNASSTMTNTDNTPFYLDSTPSTSCVTRLNNNNPDISNTVYGGVALTSSQTSASSYCSNDLANLLCKNNVTASLEPGIRKIDKLKLLNQQSMNKQKAAKITKHRVTKQNNSSNILSSLGISKDSKNPNDTVVISNGIIALSDCNESPTLNKKSNAELFDHYRYITDPMFINENNKKNKCAVEVCPRCNIEKRYNPFEGTLLCKQCGHTDPLLIEAEKINSKDKSNEKTTYPYKKSNHLNEWLNQIQAKQTTDIPDFVFTEIKNELKKNREDDLTKLTPKRICEILKKLKRTKYKEHHIYILCQISGQKPPVLTREEEETIREMFKEIQKPYDKYKPKKRINFSSYSFIIYKICELLELDHITRMLFLLKSKEKLRDLDAIWKRICYDLRWEYIPSSN